jgi:hypothetical protein
MVQIVQERYRLGVQVILKSANRESLVRPRISQKCDYTVQHLGSAFRLCFQCAEPVLALMIFLKGPALRTNQVLFAHAEIIADSFSYRHAFPNCQPLSKILNAPFRHYQTLWKVRIDR